MSGLEVAVLCLVVGVSDGDTLSARCDGEQIRIRLAEIDAPEKGQSFGERSKQSLSRICYGKQSAIRMQGRDRYGRALAHVTCEGVSANAEQVRAGMAWVYRRYARDPTLFQLEAEASASGRGLWAETSPVPPWDWRKFRRP